MSRRRPGLGNTSANPAPTQAGPRSSVGQDVLSSLRARGSDAFEKPATGASRSISIEKIAPNPKNPRSFYKNLTQLGKSITDWGQVQDALVVPKDDFLEERPHLAKKLNTDYPEAEYVVLDGNRRYYASVEAKLETLDCVVRDRYANEVASTIVPLLAHAHHEPLPPVDEALLFQTLLDLGKSQREIAAETPFPQSQISKRLKLLKLPELLKAAVNVGEVEVNAGYKLADLPSQLPDGTAAEEETIWSLQEQAWELMRDREWSAPAAIAHVVREHTSTQAREKARQNLAATGVEILAEGNPAQLLNSEEDITQAREENALAAVISTDGDISYYTTAEPAAKDEVGERRAKKSKAAPTPEAPAVDEWEQARNEAARNREKLCIELLARKPSPSNIASAVSALVLAGGYPHSKVRSLAHQWLSTHNIGPVDVGAEAWESAIRNDPNRKTLGHAAFAYAWAAAELQARQAPESWTTEVVGYLDALERDHGYELSPHEKQWREEARARGK